MAAIRRPIESPNLGPIKGIGDVAVGNVVMAFGRTSPFIRGKVLQINVRGEAAPLGKEARDAAFNNLILVAPLEKGEFASPGDLGALTFTESCDLIGMVYSHGPDHQTRVLLIRPILEALQVELG
jgi:hypothetical protein